MIADEIRLSDAERVSACWLTVNKYVAQRLSELRSKLEGCKTWEDTLQTQARIRELKLLLEIATSEQEIDNG